MNRLLFASCALALLCSCVSAAGSDARHQSGVVKTSGGKPCFSVGDNRETRSSEPLVTLVELYKRVDGRAEQIWEKSLATETGGKVKRLPPDQCVEYPDADSEHGPPLVPGQAYSATLWAALSLNGDTHSRWYHVYFCMIETDDGLAAYQVLGDDWGPCGEGVRW